MRKINLILSACFLFLISCSTQKGIKDSEPDNLFYSDKLLKPEFRIFNTHNDTTLLYFQLNTDNLLYAKKNNGQYTARVRINYNCYATGEESSLVDSGVYEMEDVDSNRVGKLLIASTKLNIEQGKNYIIKISSYDVQRRSRENSSLKIIKSELSNRQNFIAFDPTKKTPLFSDRIKRDREYILKHPTSKKLFVRYYNREFPLPAPPYSDYQHQPFDFKADSIFIIKINEEGNFNFTAAREGFYHFQSDSSQTEGFTLFTYKEPFPEIGNLQELIIPMRFILTPKEFKTVAHSNTPKAAMERQWILWTESKENAREAIVSYFKRIEECNRLFTSFTEGWKTDRGLIFLIYGKPNKTYKTEFYENWIYGEESNPNSIRFHFIKVQNPFTDNDYRLNRNDSYKPSWYRAVESWRTGKYYLFN